MAELSIWEYISELKRKHVFRNKDFKFLSHLVIYTNNLEVYKVAVFANPNKKKGKIYGTKVHTPETNRNLTRQKLKKEIEGSENGYKLFIYYFGTDNINCYEGEN